MLKLRALIVDDELHARENLELLLEEFCPEIQVLGQADGILRLSQQNFLPKLFRQP